MYATNNSKNLFLLFLVLVVLLSFAGLLLTLESNKLTANIIAQGGSITDMTISQNVSTSHWSVIYGSFDELSGLSSVNISPSTIENINVSSFGYDSSMVIIASLNNINLSDVVQAPTSIIDAYLGLGSASLESGTNTFNTLYNLSIGNMTVELFGTKTISVNGSFITAAFLSGGTLAFVTTTINGTAYDNTSAFFQFLLPVNVVEEYSLSVVSNITCPVDFSMNATLDMDNQTVNVNWSSVPGALNYELHFVDGFNVSHHIDFNSGSSFNQSTNFFSEIPLSNNRFYSVDAILPAYRCKSANIVGMYRLNLTPTANLISFPFTFVNDSVDEFVRPFLDSFVAINGYNNSAKSYNFYIQFGGNIFNNFNSLSIGNAYWLTINESINVTMVGTVGTSLSEQLFNQSNLVGFPIIQGNNSVSNVLQSVDGSYVAINGYNNSLKAYNFYIIFGGSVFNNFDVIQPTGGYWITANESNILNIS